MLLCYVTYFRLLRSWDRFPRHRRQVPPWWSNEKCSRRRSKFLLALARQKLGAKSKTRTLLYTFNITGSWLCSISVPSFSARILYAAMLLDEEEDKSDDNGSSSKEQCGARKKKSILPSHFSS